MHARMHTNPLDADALEVYTHRGFFKKSLSSKPETIAWMLTKFLECYLR